ncbi:MAG TPA: hypothetical protein VK017_08050 [Sphingobacterium sp.]|nr:hypothetical protein [Sphingobacterium sp.]
MCWPFAIIYLLSAISHQLLATHFTTSQINDFIAMAIGDLPSAISYLPSAINY